MSSRQWLWLALLSLFWGSAFIFMEIALRAFSPSLIVLGRMSVAAVALNGSLLRSPKQWDVMLRSPRSLWLKCGGLSLLNNLLPFGLVVWGQQHISASLASILIAAAPLFTVVLAVFWTRERLTFLRGLGVVLGFAGVIVLIGPEVLRGFDLKGLGELAILGAALSYAIAGFVGRRFKDIPAPQLSTMTVTMGALLMLALTAFMTLGAEPTMSEPFFLLLMRSWQWPAGLAVLCLGLFSTASAYLIYYRLLAQAGVVNTSLVSFLVPISALILGAIFLGERLDGTSVIGMSLILSGLAILDGQLLRGFQKRSL